MRPLCCLLTLGSFCLAQDPGCPKYPEAVRTRWESALERDRLNTAFRRAPHPKLNGITISLPRVNFIDTLLFGKMSDDGAAPAPLTTDAEFIRRAYVDLTGRIPQPEKVIAFLNDTSTTKRARLIEDLLVSDAYVSQFTLYFANQFQVTRSNGTNVHLAGRNLFYNFVRSFVQQDRPYNQFVQELLTASGDSDTVPGVNYFVRWISGNENNPPQDFWDDMTDFVTTQFLGFRTACISCHNGRAHLENINLYLAPKRRAEFWNSSAFFARTDFFMQGEQDGNRVRFLLQDRSYGNYNGAVPVTNPGNRPQRFGANVTQPAFILNGAGAETSAWRSDFVKMVTRDRQFARATVNYLWAYFFNTGIVDPPDGWDLARIDPSNPPPSPWPVQNTQPELLEALTDAFINSNYSIKTMVRTIVNSNVYQLSSRYTGKWNPVYAADFARHDPKRLSAEELWDAITIATQTEQPMNVAGFPNPVMYANELPDPYEPWDNGNITNFLSTLGRGNYTTIPRDSSPTLLGLLFLMNQYDVFQRVSEPYGVGNPQNRAARVAFTAGSDTEAIRQIYLATLARYPSDAEVKTVLAAAGPDPRWVWLPRMQWALINKLEFIFNN
jgi:Protein of unknown function (DUF1549)/Protein of unknown function (DUF1553)